MKNFLGNSGNNEDDEDDDGDNDDIQQGEAHDE